MDSFKPIFKKSWVALLTLFIGWGLGVSGVTNTTFAAWLFGAAAFIATIAAFVEVKDWQDKYIPAPKGALLDRLQGWKGFYISKVGQIGFPLKAYPSASGPTKYGDKRRFGW